MSVVVGTSSGDSLEGGVDNDSLYGLGGNDTLFGFALDDFLFGGTGSNTLDGGLGNDTYYLDSVTDVLIDAGGIDLVRVGAGASGITLADGIEIANAWGIGARTITGGATDNTLLGGTSADVLDGGDGADRLDGRDGTDSLTGGAMDDRLDGGAGNDRLFGGAGNDILIGGAGNDSLDGGLGDDTYYLDSPLDVVIESGGVDWIRLGVGISGIVLANSIENASVHGLGGRTITGNQFANILIGGTGTDVLEGLAGADRLDGGGGADTLYGSGQADLLKGEAGNDTLYGGDGDDRLAGGAGTNLLNGGFGNDIYYLDSATDVIVDAGGTDLVRVGAGASGMTLASGIENANAWSAGARTFTGNSGDNTLWGGAASDRLSGGAGNDWLVGGAGNDTLTGGSDDDTFLLRPGSGRDTVSDFVAGDDRIAFEDGAMVVAFSGTTAILNDGSALIAGNGHVWTVDDFAAVIELGSLTPAQGFIVQGDAAGDRAGNSVAGAGDLNGDGFADLVVGAPNGDDGGSAAGEAYVVFGHASGFGALDGRGRAAIDPSNVASSFAPAIGFVVQGDAINDNAGYDVASAGDVNGDGFSDLIVGAPGGDDGGASAGESYIVFGKASGFGTVDGSGRAVIDLGNTGSSFVPAVGFLLQGETGGDFLGAGVASAGDVNGDGFADLIVGAEGGDDGGGNSGEAYVVFGAATGLGTVDGSGRAVIDLTSLAPARGFIVQGDAAFDEAGGSVSSAGDINGDGFADLLVGAYYGDDGGTNAGEAYVVFGKASGFGTLDGAGRAVIDLSNAASSFVPQVGFVIQGDAAGDWAGRSVSAGDVNGDGFADLIVGAMLGGDGGIYAGEAYVVYGKASGFGAVDGTGRAVVDLTTLAPADGFVMQGGPSDGTGSSVSVGDVNGDGLDDLIVGAQGTGTGSAYVVFGNTSGLGTVDGTGRAVLDLLDLALSDGVVIQGDAVGDFAGKAVSVAGDVNGDGFADVMVGAALNGDGGNDAGAAYLVFGGAFGRASTSVTNTGTGAAEVLIGGLGDDTLSGGGADAIRSGNGNDTLTVTGLAFRAVDGGGGSDTLVLSGSGQSFDFTVLADSKVSGIEAIDFTGSGNNTLTLGMFDVLNISDTAHEDFTAAASQNALVVLGNAGDTLDLVGYDPDGGGAFPAAVWQLVASDVGLDGAPAGAFDIYYLMRSGSPLASVAVSLDVLTVT